MLQYVYCVEYILNGDCSIRVYRSFSLTTGRDFKYRQIVALCPQESKETTTVNLVGVQSLWQKIHTCS